MRKRRKGESDEGVLVWNIDLSENDEKQSRISKFQFIRVDD